MANSQSSLPVAEATAHVNRIVEDPSTFKFFSFIKQYERMIGLFIDDPTKCDFCLGNPQEFPSNHLVEIFQQSIIPRTPMYYAYRTNTTPQRHQLTISATKRYSFSNLDSQDVFLTNGNSAGISLALHLVIQPGDDVLYLDPGWFLNSMLILKSGATPKSVRMALGDTQADDEADMHVLLNAIDDHTRVIILNQPHNPTGKVYSRQWLERFSEKLLEITHERGHPVYVISDEAYSDYMLDGEIHHTFANIYPYTFLAYTYNKVTLAPSQRVGYLILSPHMPGKEMLRKPLLVLQMSMSWCFPNAMMMESIPKLETMRDEFKPDIISRRRDDMINNLMKIGYKIMVKPRGTFYILVKSPIEDDLQFCNALAKEKVFVLPGDVVQAPGCFRICLTATDDMIRTSIEGFRKCFEEFST